MKVKYFGDSYDVVKQSLLRWLKDLGPWAVHPMFTESVRNSDIADFSYFLGQAPAAYDHGADRIALLSTEVLNSETDRQVYFASAQACESHLFLDPDTGLRLKIKRGSKAPTFLFGQELVSIALKRPKLLTLVYDQSLSRGREREQVETKLKYLASHGFSGFAYVSHACFILLSREKDLMDQALDAVRQKSRLPANRFVVREPMICD